MVKINLKNGNMHKQRLYLRAELILRYLLSKDNRLDTLIMCNSSKVNLVTTDQSLYEALGSIKGYDNMKLNKLIKFL